MSSPQAAYTSPTSWYSLSDNLKNINLTLPTFKRHLNTFFFSSAHYRFLIKICHINQLLLLIHLVFYITEIMIYQQQWQQ